MKTFLIYVFIAVAIRTEFVQTRDIVDLVIDTSGDGLPVTNDKHYDFYVNDYFGLINGYTVKTGEIKKLIEQDNKQWTDKLKSKSKDLEILKSAHTTVLGELMAYENEVQSTYKQISPIGIGEIVKAVNHMRASERSFYAKFKLNSKKCHDFADQNSIYKWEKPAINCATQSITTTLALQLQYTYDLNVYYARLLDETNRFVKLSDDGEKSKFLTVNLKKANDELLNSRTVQIKSIQNLLMDTKSCAENSKEIFEKLQKTFTQQATECF